MEKNIEIVDINALYNEYEMSDLEYRKGLFRKDFTTESILEDLSKDLLSGGSLDMNTEMKLLADLMPLNWTIHSINNDSKQDDRKLSLEQNYDETYKNQLMIIREHNHFMLVAIDHGNKKIICFDPAGNFAERFGVKKEGEERISGNKLFYKLGLFSMAQDNKIEFTDLGKMLVNNDGSLAYSILDVCKEGLDAPQNIVKDQFNCGIYCLKFSEALGGNGNNSIEEIIKNLHSLNIGVERNNYAKILKDSANKDMNSEFDRRDEEMIWTAIGEIKLSPNLLKKDPEVVTPKSFEKPKTKISKEERIIHRANTYPLYTIKEENLEQSVTAFQLENSNKIPSNTPTKPVLYQSFDYKMVRANLSQKEKEKCYNDALENMKNYARLVKTFIIDGGKSNVYSDSREIIDGTLKEFSSKIYGCASDASKFVNIEKVQSTKKTLLEAVWKDVVGECSNKKDLSIESQTRFANFKGMLADLISTTSKTSVSNFASKSGGMGGR